MLRRRPACWVLVFISSGRGCAHGVHTGSGRDQDEAAAESEPALVGGARGSAAGAGLHPAGGHGTERATQGRVGGLGGQGRGEVALGGTVILAIFVVVHAVDHDNGLPCDDRVGHGLGDLDAASFVGDLAALGGVETVHGQRAGRAGVAGLGQRDDHRTVCRAPLGGVEVPVFVRVVGDDRALMAGIGAEVDVCRVGAAREESVRGHRDGDRGSFHRDRGHTTAVDAVEGNRLEVRVDIAVSREGGAGAQHGQQGCGSKREAGELVGRTHVHSLVGRPGVAGSVGYFRIWAVRRGAPSGLVSCYESPANPVSGGSR